jgi:hypothetical protein
LHLFDFSFTTEKTSVLSFPKDFRRHSAKAQERWEMAVEKRRISRSLSMAHLGKSFLSTD